MPLYRALASDVQLAPATALAVSGVACRCCPGGISRSSRACRYPSDMTERANAQLKAWRILRKLRCCPWRAGQLAKAIHVLQAREIAG